MDIINSLLDNLDQAVLILNKEGIILLYNRMAERLSLVLLGKSLSLGSHVADLKDLKTSLHVREILERIHLGIIIEKYFANSLHEDWITFTLEFKFIPVLNRKKEVDYIHVIIKKC